MRYRAVFRPAGLPGGSGSPVETVLQLPKPERHPEAVVSRVYPSADRLPENQLKFYLHFSAPMREGVFLNYCRLLDQRGEPVLEQFRETELWSEDHRRLTLWLHPGLNGTQDGQ